MAARTLTNREAAKGLARYEAKQAKKNAPLDVWGMHYGRDTRAIAAVRSRAEFVRLLGSGFSDHYVKNYGSTTGNPDELAIARAMPGQLILTDAYGPSHGVYTRQSDGARFTTIHEADGVHVYGLAEVERTSLTS